jgi:hypothetical protein
MVQPKTPPLSVRLGEVRTAQIDAYAVKYGLTRHAAVLELIDLGLHGPTWVASQRPTPKPLPGSAAAAKKAVTATVPLAGTFERKPYQKGQKR